MFTIQYAKEGGRAVAMALLPPLPSNSLHSPDSVVLAGEEKKEEYAKPRPIGSGVSYGKIGLTSVAVTQDFPSGMPWFFKKNNSSAFGTVYYLNQDNSVPNCLNSYVSLHAFKPNIT